MTFRRIFIITVLITLTVATAAARGNREPGELVGPEEAFKMWQDGEAVLVDVRSEAAYVDIHLAGAISVPLPTVGQSAGNLQEQGGTIILYCSCPAEETSIAAADELISRGLTDVLVLEGGIRDWAMAGLPLRSGGRP